MTSRQKRVLTVVTLAVVGVIALILTSGCADEVVNPQQVVTPSWKPNEVRPMFTSCTHAQLAEFPLPIGPADPGWNERLDHDANGVIC